MSAKHLPAVVLVTRRTRLRDLLKRQATKGQAAFVLASARRRDQGRRAKAREELEEAAPAEAVEAFDLAEQAADFEDYRESDSRYDDSVGHVRAGIMDLDVPVTVIERDFLPQFDFSRAVAVVVVGQDGLVANAAKYVGDLPVIGVNPDPDRYDGVLLPFGPGDARAAVEDAIHGRYRSRRVTLAEATLGDGQRLLAFNDLFVGCRTHQSARYTIQAGSRMEPQSSSGVIVSTGAGSTGWMSSLFHMAAGLAGFAGVRDPIDPLRLPWDAPRLFWAVREPFLSRQSRVDLVAGTVEGEDRLVLESLMPESGVIFSDGIEDDFLEFNTGAVARIGVSDRHATLMVR